MVEGAAPAEEAGFTEAEAAVAAAVPSTGSAGTGEARERSMAATTRLTPAIGPMDPAVAVTVQGTGHPAPHIDPTTRDTVPITAAGDTVPIITGIGRTGEATARSGGARTPGGLTIRGGVTLIGGGPRTILTGRLMDIMGTGAIRE